MLKLPGVSDPRVLARGEWLLDQIATLGTLVLNHVGGGYAGEMAAHRFLSSPYVTPEGILGALGERTGQACAGRRIVAAQDTTEINFSGRDRARRGLGPGGDGKTPGFFIHAVVAVDLEDEAVAGVVDARIWTRGSQPVPPRGSRPLEEKESERWVWGCQAAGARLSEAEQIVEVCDQEGDTYSHFAQRPAKVELVVRARHDRKVEAGEDEEQTCLSQVIAKRPRLITTAVKVSPQKVGDKGRVAQVTLRSSRVRIQRPAKAEPGDAAVLELGLVEALEEAPPAGVEPLHWRLLTTLPVETTEEAQEIVRLYRLRWRIEEVFRALKRDGLALEETQVQEAGRLFRLAAIALGAAVRILQLVDARDGSPRSMSDVLDPRLQTAVVTISKAREGIAVSQKNPHPEGSLAWLAWVVARHGGWNCRGKPPGPKTMATGWQRFSATLAGYLLAMPEILP